MTDKDNQKGDGSLGLKGSFDINSNAPIPEFKKTDSKTATPAFKDTSAKKESKESGSSLGFKGGFDPNNKAPLPKFDFSKPISK